MSRFYFNVEDGTSLTDDVGSELDNIDAAKTLAMQYAGQLIGDGGAALYDRGDWEMRVADDGGRTLFTLIFAGFDSASAMTIQPYE